MKTLIYLALGMLLSSQAIAADNATLSANIEEYSVPRFNNVECEKQFKGASTLNWGLCEFESVTKSGMNRSTTELREGFDRTSRILAQAQQEGLTVRQQNIATLFEGLSHCESAKNYWNGRKMIPSASGEGEIPDTYAVTGFCSARTLASGSFSDVRFNELLVNKVIVDDSGKEAINSRYAEDLINRMAVCQKEVIAEYTRCGQLSPQPVTTVTEIARDAARLQLVNYFGCSDTEFQQEMASKPAGSTVKGRCETLGGSAPATAMFARKINRLQLVTGPSGAKLENLGIRAGELQLQLDQYKNQFYNVAQPTISSALNEFQAATLITANIYEEYQLWAEGLLGAPTISSLDTRNNQLKFMIPKLATVATDLAASVERLTAMLIPPEQKAEQVVELCRLYYCGIWNKNMEFAAAGTCSNPNQKQSSACTGTVTIEGVTSKVVDICKDLPAVFRTKKLNPEQTRLCMAPILERNHRAIPNPAAMFDAIVPL